jgi:hypothetical protein
MQWHVHKGKGGPVLVQYSLANQQQLELWVSPASIAEGEFTVCRHLVVVSVTSRARLSLLDFVCGTCYRYFTKTQTKAVAAATMHPWASLCWKQQHKESAATSSMGANPHHQKHNIIRNDSTVPLGRPVQLPMLMRRYSTTDRLARAALSLFSVAAACLQGQKSDLPSYAAFSLLSCPILSTVRPFIHPPLALFVPAAPPLSPAVNPNHTLKASPGMGVLGVSRG